MFPIFPLHLGFLPSNLTLTRPGSLHFFLTPCPHSPRHPIFAQVPHTVVMPGALELEIHGRSAAVSIMWLPEPADRLHTTQTTQPWCMMLSGAPAEGSVNNTHTHTHARTPTRTRRDSGRTHDSERSFNQRLLLVPLSPGRFCHQSSVDRVYWR